MQRWSGWLGAGAVTVGVSAAVLAGAGVAGADIGAAGGSDAGASAPGADSRAAAKSSARERTAVRKTDKADKAKKLGNAGKAAKAVEAGEAVQRKVDRTEKSEMAAGAPAGVETAQQSTTKAKANAKAKAGTDTEVAPAAVSVPVPESDAVEVRDAAPATARSTTSLKIQQPVPVPSQTGLPALVTFVGNLVFGALTLLEQIVVGPPALPANSTVTVQTSTLNVGGNKVQANWYFPDTDTPPERLIVLQHGFLATGPMYSYTAAVLAERTGAIVVTPTFTSNFLAGTGFWLGGDALYRSFANLFLGDRQDLTASAVAAGYAEHYGLDPTEAVLPKKFAIVGHSLGGAFAAGVTGYLAANGAADDLVGAIMLDGVPTRDIMPTAMGLLRDYEEESGHSVPIRQIAAPPNPWNSVSNANEWLNRERPGVYNGVILTGGVHMDSMQGGNKLIQFLAFLFAGFPTAANQAAVQELAVDWLDEWFSDADVEDPALGSTITIPTPYGDAHGVVIGTPAVESQDADNLVA